MISLKMTEHELDILHSVMCRCYDVPLRDSDENLARTTLTSDKDRNAWDDIMRKVNELRNERNKKIKTYVFEEPHPTGGHTTVEITEKQILKYMKKAYGNRPASFRMTDQQLIEEFVVIHWAWEKKENE